MSIETAPRRHAASVKRPHRPPAARHRRAARHPVRPRRRLGFGDAHTHDRLVRDLATRRTRGGVFPSTTARPSHPGHEKVVPPAGWIPRTKHAIAGDGLGGLLYAMRESHIKCSCRFHGFASQFASYFSRDEVFEVPRRGRQITHPGGAALPPGSRRGGRGGSCLGRISELGASADRQAPQAVAAAAQPSTAEPPIARVLTSARQVGSIFGVALLGAGQPPVGYTGMHTALLIVTAAL